jgi:hypothetical protein
MAELSLTEIEMGTDPPAMGTDPLPALPPPEDDPKPVEKNAFLHRKGPAPTFVDRLCSWWCNCMNPHGYSTMMKRRGFENYAYMSPKLARYVGRRVMLLLYLAWPIVGFVLGFGLSFALDTP